MGNKSRDVIGKVLSTLVPSTFAGLLVGTIVGKALTHIDPPTIYQLPPKYYGIERRLKRTLYLAKKKYKTARGIGTFTATLGSTLLLTAVSNLSNYDERTEFKIVAGGFLLGFASALFLLSKSPLNSIMSSEAMLLAELF